MTAASPGAQDPTLDDAGALEPAARPGVVGRFVGPYTAIAGNRRLTRFLASEFVSSIGDWLYLVAMLVVVAEEADPVVLGLVGGARVLPYVFLSGIGGVIADRYDRRLILIATDLARGALMVGLAGAIAVHAPVVVIVVLVVLAACGSSIAGPALSAYLPSLANDESELGPANAAWATLDNVAFIIGPAVAGALTAAGGASGAMLLNAASFGVVAAVLSTLPRETGSAVAEAAADVSEARAPVAPGGAPRRIVERIAAPLLVDLGVSIVGGALGIATVVIATDQLHAGETGTGWLNAATGIGGVVGGVVAGRVVNAPPARLFAVGGVVGGLGLLALGNAGALTFAIASMAVASGGLLLVDVANSTYLQRVVDDDVRGRASGIFHTLGSLAFAGGSLVLPILAAAVGVGAALAVVVVVGAVFVAAGILTLRRRDAPGTRASAALRTLQASALGGLPIPQLAAAAAASTPVAVEAGAVVLREGDVADAAYVVDSGTLEVTIHGKVRRRLGPGDLFGERGILLGAPRSATITAVDDASLVRLDRDAFLALVRTETRVSDQLLALYGGRR